MKRSLFLCALLPLLWVMSAQDLIASDPFNGIASHYTPDALTLDPNAKVWEKAPSKVIQMMPQMIFSPRGGSPKTIHVQALHNGRQIAFRVRWKDATKDAENAPDTYRDAVALQFPVQWDTTPSPFMGNPGTPVNIWQWRADWQAEADGIDIYKRQPKQLGYMISPLDQAILKKQYPKKHDPKAACVEFIATGWGTLTRQKQQDVKAKGIHRNGHWHVVFLRDRKRRDLSDTSFPLGKEAKVSFALWDGSAREAFSRKAILMAWTPLALAKMPEKKQK